LIAQTKLIWTAIVAYFAIGESITKYKSAVFVLMIGVLSYMTMFTV
jgi:hypothetical protein